MKKEELDKILELHKLWLDDKEGGIKANLYNADLREADLCDADLRYANLYNADLRNADLFNANLYNSDLRNANLREADLCYANLYKANLQGADLKDIKVNYSTIGYHLFCPESGSFIGFKKLENDLIAKIEIPTEAKRSSATTRKCRAEFVKVLEITDKNGNKFNKGYTLFSGIETVYDVGKITRADSWDENRWNECSNSIHFFLIKEEAMFW